MNDPRSMGPTIVGIFNIPMGILGGIGAWMYMGEASQTMSIGSALHSAAASNVSDSFTTGGSAMMFKGLIALIGFAAAAFGGIGLIRRSGWGRFSTIAGGTLITTFMIFRSMQGDMTPFTWGLTCYAIVMTLGMFLPAWKAQFCAKDDATGFEVPSELQQFRKAA